MRRQTCVVTLVGVFALLGCDADVDSPFTAVSAGGTGTVPPATQDGTTSGGPSNTTGAEVTSDGPTTGGDSTGPSPTTDPTAGETTAADPCVPDPCTPPEVCVDGACTGVATPLAGEVVFNEIQPNPDIVSDEQGEWLELHNTAALALDLNGCELSDQGSDNHTITSSILIEPGGYALLGRFEAANGGVTLDYAYGNDISLANGDDEIELRCGGTVIDGLIYSGSWPFGAGASAQLTPGAGASNDDPSQWCESQLPYGDGDRGSPGEANAPC
ncbi:MAG: lamin tail domain-containing protein [Nannocystaceae bacterium]|nr:lamin tail domain-containing protein [Nannocystaceae bacterium]